MVLLSTCSSAFGATSLVSFGWTVCNSHLLYSTSANMFASLKITAIRTSYVLGYTVENISILYHTVVPSHTQFDSRGEQTRVRLPF
ncbi:hypothetical protein M441DRAFT_58130 [Trichoderma asperellum CBS 433.97]|uniref:Uncharacterized protein n=1 Tax=Trichoderma asperellum (strain ATCC 204424 / CBS 433.97 / NBRC 101777) TaxID=1042311 RepID=A0A2T3Z775_TRIA4|nr:hypothetical protein M441DRAFT_58130 [Trichoderma asperellum CBS 433.97]PTB40635.1 hypothetical protein M441DRAFT_58130 [Trichoderma asperellum CBS 433.97]